MELTNTQPKSSQCMKRTSSKNKKVLIVDDDQDLSAYLKWSLETQNPSVKCTVVNNPYEAVLKLTDENFDLAFIDQKLPGMDGSELLMEADRFIEDDPSVPLMKKEKQTPVILMSGQELENDVKERLWHFDVRFFLRKAELPQFLKLGETN